MPIIYNPYKKKGFFKVPSGGTKKPSDASFSYSASSYAKDGTDPTPTITGDSGGTFTATPSGLTINSSTGEVTLSTSTINSYSVKYTLSDGTFSTQTLGITAASFSNVYSMDFDGVDDYIDCGNITALNGVTEATWMGWFNRSGTSPYYLFGTWGTTSGEKRFVPLQNGGVTGSIVVYMATSTGVQKTMFKHTYNVTATIGNWHHYAFVYNEAESSNADKMKVYMDGVELANALPGAALTSLNSSTANFEIGKLGGYTTNEFTGNIDEVAVFTSALSPSDVSTIASAPSDLTSYSPTAWYRMGENGVYKSPQWLLPENSNKDKVSNYIFDFDGVDDYVDIFDSVTVPADFQSIGNSNSYSISAWIKTTQDASGHFYWYSGATIIELRQQQGANSHIPFNFGISYNPSGGYSFLTFGRSNDYATGADFVFSTADVNDGNWHHVAITIDVNDYIFYVDGSTAGSGTFSTATGDCSVSTTTSNMQIGSRSRDSGLKDRNLFDGQVDELSIFNYKLTSGNITSIYNSGVPNNLNDLSTAPILWYRMGEEATFSTNWTVPDQIGSNDGTSANMTIEDRVGEAPNSASNSLSYNMVEADRETDVPS